MQNQEKKVRALETVNMWVNIKDWLKIVSLLNFFKWKKIV